MTLWSAPESEYYIDPVLLLKLSRKSTSSSSSMFFMKPNTSAYTSQMLTCFNAQSIKTVLGRTMNTTAESILSLWCYIFMSKKQSMRRPSLKVMSQKLGNNWQQH